MQSKGAPTRIVAVFLSLTLALSSVFYILIILAGKPETNGGALVFGLMWCPGIAAIITQFYSQGNILELGWHWGNTRYQLISYGLPILYLFIVYAAIWITGFGGFYNHEFADKVTSRLLSALEYEALSRETIFALYVLVSATLGVLASCVTALGEEIGWRGLLVPQLAKMFSYTRVALISGAIWAIWRFPIILFVDHQNATPVWYSLICFTILTLGISFALAWLRLKSGSLWTAVLLHASHNQFIQHVFTPFTYDTGKTAYFIGEFGAGMAVVAIGIGYLFWRKRAELSVL